MRNYKNLLKPLIFFQKGVVLFVALIALVVLSLAAVALIRSVDTNTIIAGNLSFKQSSLLSADRGAEAAIKWLSTQTNDDLADDILANGYYATMLEDAKDLVDASGVSGTIANPDVSGNSITYVIQRLCRTLGLPTPDQLVNSCSTGPSENKNDLSEMGQESQTQSGMVYRITVKVIGPRNTVTYIQTFAY